MYSFRHRVNVRNVHSFLLILYLVGLVMASSAAHYVPVMVFSLFVLILGLFSKEIRFSRDYIPYYVLLTLLANISLIDGSFDVLGSNILFTVGSIVNIVIYELFAYNKLLRGHVEIFIWLLMIVSTAYVLITGKYNTIFFGNQNATPFLVLLVLFLSDLYLSDRKVTAWAVWCFSIFFTLSSHSRSGFLAVVAYFLLRNIKSKIVQVFFFVCTLSALIVLYSLGYSDYITFKLFGKPISYLSHRDVVWSQGWRLISSRPFGVGYRGYSDIFEDVLGVHYSVHNTYLNILLEFGWPYFIVYLVFLIKLVLESKNSFTTALIFSVYLRCLFESGVPFGFSLPSALLLLPFYIGRGYTGLGQSEIKDYSKTG